MDDASTRYITNAFSVKAVTFREDDTALLNWNMNRIDTRVQLPHQCGICASCLKRERPSFYTNLKTLLLIPVVINPDNVSLRIEYK